MSTLVVTGGASGIGQQVAYRALSDWPESKCALVDLRFDHRHMLTGQFGSDRVFPVRCDVSDPRAVQTAVDSIVEWGGSVKHLVNSAGIYFKAPSIDLSLDDWHRVLGVHLDGTLLFSQAVGKHMAEAEGGAIVNLASVAMFFGWPGRLAYATAKAAIAELTRTLAVEWAEYGVRVNAVAPGYIETPFLKEIIELGQIDADATRRLHALGRFGTADEVASAILFLLSDASSFITGEVLVVDGGFCIKKSP